MIKLEKYVKIIFTKSFKGGEYMDNEIDISEYLVWYVPFGPDSYHHFEEAFYGEKYKNEGYKRIGRAAWRTTKSVQGEKNPGDDRV